MLQKVLPCRFALLGRVCNSGQCDCMVGFPAYSAESESWGWALLLLNACRGNTAIHVSVSLHETYSFTQVHTGSQSSLVADTDMEVGVKKLLLQRK